MFNLNYYNDITNLRPVSLCTNITISVEYLKPFKCMQNRIIGITQRYLKPFTLLPDPLRLRIVEPVRDTSMSQIDIVKIYLYSMEMIDALLLKIICIE